MFIHNSGRFSYSLTSDLFVVHNLYDGFDAYMMKSRAHFRSYRFPVSEEDNVPLSCILINDGRHIVCGTTFGKAVVLDAMTLAHQADLTHCRKCFLAYFATPLKERNRFRPRSGYSRCFCRVLWTYSPKFSGVLQQKRCEHISDNCIRERP